MTIRKCIYTGKDSNAKDQVLPNNPFNWTNKVPTTKEYKNSKNGNLPTELEMQANETFHLLELARNRVLFYEAKLKEIQDEIGGCETPEPVQKLSKVSKSDTSKAKKTPKKVSKRDVEIEKAIEEKEIMEDSEKAIEKVLKKKSNLWD
jgi:hypothetical protein